MAGLVMTACNAKTGPDDGSFDGFSWSHEWDAGRDTAASDDSDAGVWGGGGTPDAESGPACWDEDLGSATGNAVGAGNQTEGDNVYDCLGGTGREMVYRWLVPSSGSYTISTHGSASDTVLEVRVGCEGESLGCNDDSTMGLSSELRLELEVGTEMVIVADSFSPYSEGPVVVNIN